MVQPFLKWTLSALVLSTSATFADTVELVNGDRVQGEVSSLNDQQLSLKSELLGDLTLPRKKVRAIYFGVVPQAVPAAPAVVVHPNSTTGAPAPGTPEALIEKLTGKSSVTPTADPQANGNLLQQLQQQGLDPKALSEVQQTFPLLAVPEVGAHFQKNLSGLMSGSLDVQDIRRQAIEARDMLNDLKADLGPEAAALNGYLGILDRFIAETGTEDATRDPESSR